MLQNATLNTNINTWFQELKIIEITAV